MKRTLVIFLLSCMSSAGQQKQGGDANTQIQTENGVVNIFNNVAKPSGEDSKKPAEGHSGTTSQSKETSAKATGEARGFTRISARHFPAEAVVDLERLDRGKHIPLPGKKVSVSLQYKDGPLKRLEVIVTDADGVVRYAIQSMRDKLPPT